MSDQPQQDPEKKIIIDEDWKERVQAEKEAAKQGSDASVAGESDATDKQSNDAPAQEPQQGPSDADIPLPPPSLEMLATTLATQAMISMGMLPHPTTGEQNVHLDQAKHLIDMIEMLQEKTQGNRTAEETVAINNMLHQLRMGFVAMQQQAADS